MRRIRPFLVLTLLLGTIAFATSPTWPQRTTGAYFGLCVFPHLEKFIFKLTNPTRIQEARDILMTQSASGNFIDETQFFVTQHYRDFFGREPDAPGLQFWVNNIESCGAEAACREVKRIDTSAAFFLSIEFQETGYLAHRFYRASLGRRPLFAEFLADQQAIGNGVVVNAPGWEQLLESNKRAFADSWVTRSSFRSIYDGLSNQQFVDTLIANTGTTFTDTDRNAFIDVLNTQAMTRAQVLRLIAEDQSFDNAEYNQAFVEMEYFGYLRRDPDDGGFNFWLGKLNQFGGDFRRADMVKSFLVSGEYRQRFGPP
jgi:hypothetical protein